MQKAILVSFMLLFVVSSAFSQFGIKGGLNSGTFVGDDKAFLGPDPTNRPGLTGGISYKIDIAFGFAIQPEVLYAQKGAVYELSPIKRTYQMDYIDVPVLLKFTLPIPVIDVFVEGGASYSILVMAKTKDESPAYGSLETNVKDNFNKNDVSLVFGAGVKILFIEVDARYVLGQTKLDKDGNMNLYNRCVMLTAGFRF
jgi:hypothetical protein